MCKKCLVQRVQPPYHTQKLQYMWAFQYEFSNTCRLSNMNSPMHVTMLSTNKLPVHDSKVLGMALHFGLEPKSSGLPCGLCTVKKGENRKTKVKEHLFQEWHSSVIWCPSLSQGHCCRFSCMAWCLPMVIFKNKTLQAPWSCHLLINVCEKPGKPAWTLE